MTDGDLDLDDLVLPDRTVVCAVGRSVEAGADIRTAVIELLPELRAQAMTLGLTFANRVVLRLGLEYTARDGELFEVCLLLDSPGGSPQALRVASLPGGRALVAEAEGWFDLADRLPRSMAVAKVMKSRSLLMTRVEEEYQLTPEDEVESVRVLRYYDVDRTE